MKNVQFFWNVPDVPKLFPNLILDIRPEEAIKHFFRIRKFDIDPNWKT